MCVCECNKKKMGALHLTFILCIVVQQVFFFNACACVYECVNVILLKRKKKQYNKIYTFTILHIPQMVSFVIFFFLKFLY